MTAGETEGTFTLTANIAETDSHAAGTATTTIRIIDTRSTPTFAWSTNAVTLHVGDAFTAPTLNNNSDGTVTYSSSNPSVATIDASTGAVTLAGGIGSTTITASVESTANYKAATASYTLTVQSVSGLDTYVLVTDINDLAAGDEIIILNYANKMAMSTNQKSNNRGATSITIKGSTAYATTDVQVITLEGDATNGWYFNTGSGYLYAASSGSNYLRTKAEKDDNAKAAISFSGYIASVVFQGSNTRNVLQYNSGNDGLFACYASASQKDVEIFKKGTPPTELTIPECRALADATNTVLALDGSTVLGNYIDAEGCHVFVRDGKEANQAIEILLAGESSAPEWAAAKSIVSGSFTGTREKTASADRLNCSAALAVLGSGNGDVTPVTLSDLTDIADYSGNSVVLIDQACTNDGTTCTIGGLTASTAFKSSYVLPYEGAYVDVGAIAYNGNTLHLIDYSEGLGATQNHRCFVYVFDENRAMALPTANNYKDVTARMVRTFYADGWNTLRLPFHDTTEDFLSVFGEGAVLSEFTGLEKDANSNTLLMRFSESNATTPGTDKRLLVKLDLSEDLVNPKFARVTIDPDKGEDKSASITLNGETYTVTYRGILAPTQIAANDGTKLFLGSAGNELVYASVTNNLRATRCYFDLSFDVLAADAAINTAFFEVGGEEVTAIDGTPVMTAKQGAVYTVQGQYVGERLEGLSKGVYIVNGKKMVIK